MIKYKCWTCLNDLESSEDMIGVRRDCPSCGTPNVVPEPLENDSIEEEGKCFLCQERNADPESKVLVECKYHFDPSLQCRKCGDKWKEAQTGQGLEKDVWYSPSCQSCGSEDVVPTLLPPMPVGKYTEVDRDIFRNNHKQHKYLTPVGKYIELGRNPVSFVQHSYSKSSYVWVRILVPRCFKCSKVHDRIVKISRGIAIGAWLVSGGIVGGIAMAEAGIGAFVMMSILCLIVVAPIAWAISRVVLRRTIGRNMPHEKDALKFPPVQALAEQGWIVQIFSLA